MICGADAGDIYTFGTCHRRCCLSGMCSARPRLVTALDGPQLLDGTAPETGGKEQILGNDFVAAGKKVVGAAVGCNLTAIFTSEGLLYLYRCRGGLNGCLGHRVHQPYRPLHAMRSLELAGETVVGASAWDKHVAVWTQSGALYLIGGNGWGLDWPVRIYDCDPSLASAGVQLVAELKNEKVVGASLGEDCIAAWTDAGVLYMWGVDADHRLGQKSPKVMDIQRVPRMVKALARESVVAAAAGSLHTAVVTASGRLYTFGSGEMGSLGHGRISTRPSNRGQGNACWSWLPRGYHESKPKVVAALATEKVVKVAVGDYQTVLSTEKGEVYTCGFGYCGLLGHGTLGYVPVTEYRKDFERGHDGSFWERYQVTPGLHCPRAITTLE